MEAIFLAIHVVVGIALIGIVLIQRSSSDGMGLGSGSGSNFMSGRQTANLLTRTTAILATIFILNSLWLGILATQKTKTSLVDQVEAVGKKSEDTKDKKKSNDKNDSKSDVESKVEKTTDKVKDSDTDKVKDSDKEDAAKKVAPVVPVAE